MTEKDITETWLLRATTKATLIPKLKQLHEILRRVIQSQANRPSSLDAISLQLVTARILENADRDIRLLVICCVVDILEIYAPEPPYDDDQLFRIFREIISILRSMVNRSGESIMLEKAYSILGSLADVGAAVILIDLSERGIQTASELVCSFFETLLSIVRPENPSEVKSYVSTILQSCIEQSNYLDQKLLDQILFPLLPSNQTESPSIYAFSQTLLRQTIGTVITPICNFVNEVLYGSNIKDSELADNIYPLIFELHKVSSNFLHRILPDLCAHLLAEDEDVRFKSTKLLGHLFASQHADYAERFHRNFRDFLNRFADLSLRVRLEMIEVGALIMIRRPSLTQQIEGHIVKRLRDSEPDARLLTLNKLFELLKKDPSLLSPATIQEMGQRVKDRKPTVRRLALNIMAKTYSRHVSSLVGPASGGCGLSVREGDEEVWERLSFVPGLVVGCWGFPEPEDRRLVIQLLQEYVIPKTFRPHGSPRLSLEVNQNLKFQVDDMDVSVEHESPVKFVVEGDEGLEDRRAAALLLMFSALSTTDRDALGSILAYKAKVRKTVQDFLDFHFANVGVGSRSGQGKVLVASSLPEDLLRKYQQHLSAILEVVPQLDRKSLPLEKLLTTKDKTVFRQIQNSLSSNITTSEFFSSRDDVCERLGSKTVAAQYIEMALDFAGYGVGGKGVGHALLLGIREGSRGAGEGDIHQLLEILSKHSPLIFEDSARNVESWLSMAYSASQRPSQTQGHSHQRPPDCCYLSQESEAETSLSSCLQFIQNTSTVLATSFGVEDLVQLLLEYSLEYNHGEYCEQMVDAACALFLTNKNSSQSHSQEETLNSTMAHAINNLISPKRLSQSSSRLTCDLSCISSLLRARDILTNNQTKKCLQFVKSIIYEPNSKTKEKIPIDCISAALKCWTVTQSVMKEAVESSNELDSDLIELIEELFVIIQNQGRLVRDRQVLLNEERVTLRVTAACSLLDLIQIRSVGKRLSVNQWHSLGWAMIDNDSFCRRKVVNKLCQVIQKTIVHPRFLAYTCLLSTYDDLSKRVENSLMFALRRLRKTVEALQNKAAQSRATSQEIEKWNALAMSYMPECILPYVLHLISHHPDFPSKEELKMGLDTAVGLVGNTGQEREDLKRIKMTALSVRLIVDCLLNSVLLPSTVPITDSTNYENLPYLLKQTDIIIQFFMDRTDPGNIGLPWVTRLARKMLRDRVKSSNQSQPYPHDIALPMDIFVDRSEVAVDGDGLSQEDDLIREEQVIERVVSKTGKSSPKLKPKANRPFQFQEKKQPLVEKKQPISSGKNVGNMKRKGVSGKENTTVRSTALGEQAKPDKSSEEEEIVEEKSRSSKAKATTKTTTSSKNKKASTKPAQTPLPPPTRTLPSRSAKQAPVSYVEMNEDEEEVERWNEEAASASRSQSGRNSKGSMSNSRENSKEVDDEDSAEIENIYEFVEINSPSSRRRNSVALKERFSFVPAKSGVSSGSTATPAATSIASFQSYPQSQSESQQSRSLSRQSLVSVSEVADELDCSHISLASVHNLSERRLTASSNQSPLSFFERGRRRSSSIAVVQKGRRSQSSLSNVSEDLDLEEHNRPKSGRSKSKSLSRDSLDKSKENNLNNNKPLNKKKRRIV